uniref:DUF4743 domain-containing protein n=1 Tax=Clastoptera arizonana TaxID=38151 RepID=A0A1B6E1C3_9HEMI
MASKQIPMSRLLKLAQKFNCFYLSDIAREKCRPFVVEGYQVGLVRPDVMDQLMLYPEVFFVHHNSVTLNPAFRDYTERSAKVEAVLRECRAQGTFITLKGWRDECFDVKSLFNTEPLLKMDRSATCLFGICNYGVDINGYVMDKKKRSVHLASKAIPNKTNLAWKMG